MSGRRPESEIYIKVLAVQSWFAGIFGECARSDPS
jgi:hypothetical protein